MISWNAQIGGGKYCLQFETDNKDLFYLVERACQLAVDQNELQRLRNELRDLSEVAGAGASIRKFCPATQVECGECVPDGPCVVTEVLL